jgi:hypothetical protein
MTNWPRQGVRTMTLAAVLGAALMALLLMAPSAWAAPTEMAVIETRAVLESDSDDGIDAALKKALERAVRGAAAMGLGTVQISGAYRGPGYVVVQILATVAGETDESDGTAPPRPGPGSSGRMRAPGGGDPSRVGEPAAPDEL